MSPAPQPSIRTRRFEACCREPPWCPYPSPQPLELPLFPGCLHRSPGPSLAVFCVVALCPLPAGVRCVFVSCRAPSAVEEFFSGHLAVVVS